MPPEVALPDLSSQRFIIVLGKGGVGRTTVAAALALLMARRGRQTLLYQMYGKEKLAGLLGGPAAGEELVRLRENLWAVNASPGAALHQYGLMVLRFETVYRMVFENRLSKTLVRAIPGVDDYALLGKAWWHATQEQSHGRLRWDCVIVDAPATGHAVTMFKIPRAILEAVPEGPLTRTAAEVGGLLEDPARTTSIVVTLAEEMPTNETIELADKMRREANMPVSALVVNQLYPDRFPRGSGPARVLDRLTAAGAITDDPALAPVLGRARMLRSRRALNERYLARLAEAVPLPTVHLPYLFAPTLGPREMDTLTGILSGEMR